MFECLLRSRCHQYKMNIRENILNRPKMIDFFSITRRLNHILRVDHMTTHIITFKYIQSASLTAVRGWRLTQQFVTLTCS